MTRERYHQLGELHFFQGKRVELIHGEVIEMSPINIAHAQTVGFVTDVLTLVFAVGYFVNVQQPFAVDVGEHNSEPQPDVGVIAGTRRSLASHPTQAALIVEVADSTVFYDTTTKAQLYAEAGVPEYWVLDVSSRVLHVYRDPGTLSDSIDGKTYRTHTEHQAAESVSPLSAPNAAIRVADLLP
jgi:Uma2 family endonuclease